MLNAEDQPAGFKDTAGNPLAPEAYAGVFTTASADAPCNPVDTGEGFLLLNRILSHEQSSDDPPAPATEATAIGSAGVTSPRDNPISTVTLTRPGQAGESVPPIFDRFFTLAEDFESEAEMEAAWSPGAYRFVAARAGAPTIDTTLNMTDNWPPIPHILNWEAAQSVDETQDFFLRWNGIPGAGELEHVVITLVGPNGFIWSAPDLCEERELESSATSVAHSREHPPGKHHVYR